MNLNLGDSKNTWNSKGLEISRKTEGSRSKHNEVRGRFFLSTFDGSPKCTARAWVKELDTYLQLHQVSEMKAIRVAALHLEGKAMLGGFMNIFH